MPKRIHPPRFSFGFSALLQQFSKRCPFLWSRSCLFLHSLFSRVKEIAVQMRNIQVATKDHILAVLFQFLHVHSQLLVILVHPILQPFQSLSRIRHINIHKHKLIQIQHHAPTFSIRLSIDSSDSPLLTSTFQRNIAVTFVFSDQRCHSRVSFLGRRHCPLGIELERNQNLIQLQRALVDMTFLELCFLKRNNIHIFIHNQPS
mmetsp:Transcript_7473/g.13510  ORF Transcript_7473/g.13510 Transcript_7473/m.13510 type:complete len:203 (-) Transcript_7473:1046-1654(-)